MTQVHAHDGSPLGAKHRRRNVAVALSAISVTAAVALILIWPGPRAPGYTGAMVTVPSCPAGAGRCGLVVTRAPDGTAVAHENWSGAGATVDIKVPAGRYAIAAEGCAGDSIPATTVDVTSGFHTIVDLGTYWQMPGYLGRSCPG